MGCWKEQHSVFLLHDQLGLWLTCNGRDGHLILESRLQAVVLDLHASWDDLSSQPPLEPLSMSELLSMADPQTMQMWRELKLGYTETAGLPVRMQENDHEGVDDSLLRDIRVWWKTSALNSSFFLDSGDRLLHTRHIQICVNDWEPEWGHQGQNAEHQGAERRTL